MITEKNSELTSTGLVGKFLACHNLLRKIAHDAYGGLKNAPSELQPQLEVIKLHRDRIAHDLWEIINCDVYAMNAGTPDWILTRLQLETLIDDTLKSKYRIHELERGNGG